MKLGRNKDKRRPLPCGTCRGTGWIAVHTDQSKKSGGPKLVHRHCTHCHGTGKV